MLQKVTYGQLRPSKHEVSNVKILDQVVPITSGGRLLGAHVAYGRNVCNHLVEKRVLRGVAVCERVRWVPLPMAVRARLLSSLVLPATLYGSCVGGMGNNLMNMLTSAIMRAVWGTKRKLRCREIVLTLLVQGHLVDPRQVYIYQALHTMRSFVNKHPDVYHVVRNCWQRYVHGCVNVPGPIGLVFQHVISLGWSWTSFHIFERPGRPSLPVFGGLDTWWTQELREAIQLSMWSVVGRRRHDMQGIEAPQGIDRKATLALYNRPLLA